MLQVGREERSKEMTREEAIKSLQNIVEYWTYKPTEVEAARMAIEALKQPEQKGLNEWAVIIHNNAEKHGWWENERSFPEIVALCHSELSEALEAYRNGEPLTWINEGKPDGIAVEMADCLIRILDWFGFQEINVSEVVAMKHEYNETRPYKHGGKRI